MNIPKGPLKNPNEERRRREQAKAQGPIPAIETVVLDFMRTPSEHEEGTGGAWYHAGELLAADGLLEAVLNQFGQEGFRLTATGGVNVENGFGPTRLFLQRLVIPDVIDEPAKPSHLGLGDEE